MRSIFGVGAGLGLGSAGMRAGRGGVWNGDDDGGLHKRNFFWKGRVRALWWMLVLVCTSFAERQWMGVGNR